MTHDPLRLCKVCEAAYVDKDHGVLCLSCSKMTFHLEDYTLPQIARMINYVFGELTPNIGDRLIK